MNVLQILSTKSSIFLWSFFMFDGGVERDTVIFSNIIPCFYATRKVCPTGFPTDYVLCSQKDQNTPSFIQ